MTDLPAAQALPAYVVAAPDPSPLPHSPGAGGRGWLPKLFDHTLSSDISQYNHFSISSAPNFAIITMHDHGEPFWLICGVTDVTSQADLSHAAAAHLLDAVRLDRQSRALRLRRRRTAPHDHEAGPAVGEDRDVPLLDGGRRPAHAGPALGRGGTPDQ